MTPYQSLCNRIAARAKGAGLSWDTYDADFLLGVVIEWLDENDTTLPALCADTPEEQ